MSISLTLQVLNDSVSLSATSTGSKVSFYRRVGTSVNEASATLLQESNLVDQTASYVDVGPQKTLLTYYAVNDSNEVSSELTAVLPNGYSLNGATLAGDVQLGDMLFNTVDEHGTVWTMSELEGWWTTPTALIPSALRSPNEDGDYDSDGRYDARVLKFEGTFLPSSPELLSTARDRLIRAIDAVRRTQRLTLFDDDPAYLEVRLTGQPQIDTYRSTGITNFSATLRAADPIKRSVLESMIELSSGINQGGRSYPKSYPYTYGNLISPNSGQLINRGNYPAYPRIVITGPAQTLRVENVTTGAFMQLNLSLSNTQYVTIDMQQKVVLLQDSVSRRSSVSTDSTWWQLMPGVNEVRFTAFSSGVGANARIYARSSWIG